MQHWVIVDVPVVLRVRMYMTTIDTISTTHPTASASHIHQWLWLGGSDDGDKVVVAVKDKKKQKIVYY